MMVSKYWAQVAQDTQAFNPLSLPSLFVASNFFTTNIQQKTEHFKTLAGLKEQRTRKAQ